MPNSWSLFPIIKRRKKIKKMYKKSRKMYKLPNVLLPLICLLLVTIGLFICLFICPLVVTNFFLLYPLVYLCVIAISHHLRLFLLYFCWCFLLWLFYLLYLYLLYQCQNLLLYWYLLYLCLGFLLNLLRLLCLHCCASVGIFCSIHFIYACCTYVWVFCSIHSILAYYAWV